MRSDNGGTPRAEALMGALLDHAPFGYGQLDADLRVVRVNDAMMATTGEDGGSPIGRPLAELVPASVWQQIEPALRRVVEAREPVHLLDVKGTSLASPRRERRWRISYIPALHDGELLGIHAVVLETTSRWRTEQALHRSKSDLQRAHELVPLGSFELRLPSSSRDEWSEGALRIFGLDDRAAPLTSERFLAEVIHPEDRELFSRALVSSIDEGAFDVEFRVIRPDGQMRHLHSVGAPVRDARGRLKKIMGMLLDVTERRHNEAALRDRELRMRAILDTALDGILIVDHAGRIESFNRAAERMFGYSAGEVLGRNVAMLTPDPTDDEEDLSFIVAYLEDARRLPGGRREVVGRRKDGSVFPLEVGISELQLPDGQRYTGILRDLTEQRRLEREFLQAQKLEAIGRLASGIAHDFNNLLMGIMGCASIALDRLPPDEPSRRFIEEVKKAAARGATLPSQLLAFSRKRDVEPAVVDVNGTVRDMEEMLRRLVGEHIALRIESAPGELLVSIGPGHLEQALMNLVLNGRDAMTRGGELRVETSRLTLDERAARCHGLAAGPYVSLVVTDTGCGMDDETQARVFEPFFTTKDVGQGTGLGLPTVYGLVRGAGGHIELESEPDRGTRVRLLLPRVTPARLSAGPSMPGAVEGGSETILVVEDAPLVRVSVRDYLERRGYRVLEAADGHEALERFRATGGEVDLLLADVGLPGPSGPDLARALLKERPQMRVLYMSAYAPVPAAAPAWAASAPSCPRVLEKPFTEDELAAAVRELLDGSASDARALEASSPST